MATRRGAGGRDELAAGVWLAEFAALRDEIRRRSDAQQTLLVLCFTAIGAVTGLVLTEQASAELLLVVPMVTSGLGMLFLDHAHTIRAIGHYLDSVARSRLVELTDDPGLLGWEREAREREFAPRSRLRWVGPVGGVFVGSGILALAFSARSVWLGEQVTKASLDLLDDAGSRLLYVLDTVIVVFVGIRFAGLLGLRRRGPADEAGDAGERDG